MTISGGSTELSVEELDARTPVWQALAEFWLDTELQDVELDYIARVIAESPYTMKEVMEIHLLEVMPAVSANLTSMAGAWAGFDNEWLVERCRAYASRRRSLFHRARCWLQARMVRVFTGRYWRRIVPRVTALRKVRSAIREEVGSIEPFDEIERAHIEDALAWIDSGSELCRIQKPATPPKHLVSYFVLVDDDHVLLVDHKNAKLWLPTGGHVEPGEHPRATVARELREELGLEISEPVGTPLMLTCSETVGITAGHTDVSLWYVINANRLEPLRFDTDEFNSVQWFQFSEAPVAWSDPHLERFLSKLARRRAAD